MRPALWIALGSLVALAPSLAAAECRPTVTLVGDAALVASIGTDLVGRGIAIERAGSCPATSATIERRDDGLVVWISDASREVREVQTAAAVIESFVRDDVGSPLLAARPIARHTYDDDLALPAPLVWPSGLHLVAGLETSFANDATEWLGVRLSACYMIGPLCPGVRLRGSAVANEEDDDWDPTWRRKSSELLVAIDAPIRVGTYLVTLGVAGGIGGVSTKNNPVVPNRSSGFRAEAMLAVSIPLSPKLALDVYATATAAQKVENEVGFAAEDMVPPEPVGFLRLGVAMRWGRR